MDTYEKKYKEAQKWMESIYSELSHEQQMEAEAFFPELRESEDEKIRKAVIEMIHDTPNVECEDNYNVYKEDVLAWLEKQGKKQPIIVWHSINEEPEEMKELFCEWESDDATWHDVAFYDKESHTFQHAKMPINVTKWVYVDELLEKQGEQKPASKVEPKFKVGDWVVCEAGELTSTLQITGIKNGCYWFHDDTYLPVVDEDCLHIWTIGDARDGDVLHSTGLYSDCIFIYNGLDNWKFDEPNGNRAVATGYCCLSVSADNMEFGIQGPDCIEVNTVKPATKIQRDLLEKAMTDAGYTFDFENKELKKIAPSNKELEGKV